MCGYFCIGFIYSMLAGKILPIIFHQTILTKMMMAENLKMAECNSFETHNIYPNLKSVSLSATPLNAVPLNNQQQFRLNKINEISDYFVAEIK